MPLTEVQEDIPAMFRRAAINAALGSARSFYSHLARWQKHKAKAEAKGKKVQGSSARSSTHLEQIRNTLCRYAQRAYRLLHIHQGLDRHVLELGTYAHHRTNIPEGFEACSPQLVHRGDHWYLHTPIEKKLKNPLTIKKQIETNPDTKICAIDLNMDGALAVCTITRC